MAINSEPVVFEAEIRQVKSMTDHTFNLVLNLPEYSAEQAAQLLKSIGDYARVALQISNESG